MSSNPFRIRGAVFRGAIAVLVFGLITASGSGCGQRGPLYLPEPGPAADGPVRTGDAAAEVDAPGDRDEDDSADREGNR